MNAVWDETIHQWGPVFREHADPVAEYWQDFPESEPKVARLVLHHDNGTACVVAVAAEEHQRQFVLSYRDALFVMQPGWSLRVEES